MVHYRNGEWDEAISALKKAAELDSDGSATNWLFLAMAHWQLGDEDEAHKWYDKAVAWMEENNSEDEDLRRFRAEAAELLEVGEPSHEGEEKESPGRQESETVDDDEPDTMTEPLPSNSKEMPQNASNDP